MTNLNTSAVIAQMAAKNPSRLRILLETDAPFMVPSNLYNSVKEIKGKLPLSHTAMIPWTAEFTALAANKAVEEGRELWNTEKVMLEAWQNAKDMYRI